MDSFSERRYSDVPGRKQDDNATRSGGVVVCKTIAAETASNRRFATPFLSLFDGVRGLFALLRVGLFGLVLVGARRVVT